MTNFQRHMWRRWYLWVWPVIGMVAAILQREWLTALWAANTLILWTGMINKEILIELLESNQEKLLTLLDLKMGGNRE